MVFEKRVLRGLFGPKWGEVTGGRRRLHNEELCDLYSSLNKTAHVARMGRKGTRIGC
jgi:hypothetical protein